MPRSRDLSRRQETFQTLFPQRAKTVRALPHQHQLGFGAGFVRKPQRCVACAHPFGELELDCPACGAFLCTDCDTMTTPNGGDGRTCYGCMKAGR